MPLAAFGLFLGAIHRSTIFFSGIFFFAVFLSVSTINTEAAAEDRQIYGVAFPYDIIRPVDASTVKVVAGTGSIITSPAEVDSFLTTHWFGDASFVRELSPHSIETYLHGALEAKNPASAALLLTSVLRFWIPLPPNSAVLADSLSKPEYREILKKVIVDERKQEFISPLTGEVLCAFSPEEASFVRTSALSLVIVHRNILLSCLRRKLRSAAQVLDGQKAVAHAAFAAAVLGEVSPDVSELSAAAKRIQEFAQLPLPENADVLGAAASVDLPEESPQSAVGIAARSRILSEAERLIEAGKAVDALSILIRLDPERPNERVSAIAIEGLSRPIGEWIVSNNQSAGTWFKILASQDRSVRAVLIDRLYQAGSYANTARNSAAIQQLLTGMISPLDIRWKVLSFQHAFNLEREGRDDEAATILEASLPAPNWDLQIKAWKILYGEWVFIACLGVSLAWAVYRISRKMQDDLIKKQLHERQEAIAREMVEEQTAEKPEGFSYITRGKVVSEDQDEYFRILVRFGLSPSSSLAELKAAYRKKVKLVHPDTLGGHEIGANAEFMEVTQLYERALELRMRLGLPGA